MIRALLAIAGLLIIAAGTALTVSLFPGGIVVVAAGLALLVGNSITALRAVRKSRRKHEAADKAVGAAEKTAPETMRRELKRTEPRQH